MATRQVALSRIRNIFGALTDANAADQELLFGYLISEFGDIGSDAVAFLQTGQALIADGTDALTRRAAAAAYCLREALKRLLPPEPDVWKGLTDEVLNSKTRFDAVRNLPGTDQAGALNDLLGAITRLSDFMKNNEGKNVRRLARLMESRTGASLFPFALQQYQEVLRQLDSAGVHGSISLEQARDLAGRAFAVLMLIFGPFQARQPELDLLAQIDDPIDEDVSRLLSVCSGPHHLTYFMQRATSPKWLPLLSPSGVLDPPPAGGAWAAGILVERLAPEHGQVVAAWLEDVYKTWGVTEVGAAYLAMAARHALPTASETLLRALRDYPSSQWIRSQAVVALGLFQSSSSFVDRVAGVLLQSTPLRTTMGYAEEAADRLVAGLDAVNAVSRIALLTHGLAESSETRFFISSLSNFGSIEQIADVEGHEAGHLLTALMIAIGRSREFGTGAAEVLGVLEALPDTLRRRMRTWTLRQASDVSTEERVLEIARAIASRPPNTEDVLLVDEIVLEPKGDAWSQTWKEALGPPPTPEDVGRALSVAQVPVEWRRASMWHAILPAAARADWDVAVVVMAPTLPAPTRESYFEAPVGLRLESARSPFTKAELQGLSVAEAARKISTWRPTGDSLTLARELGRTLEELVSEAPQQWAKSPLETLSLLRHATYVNHYFAGLTKTTGLLAGLGPGIMEAIVVAMTHPWGVVRLGGDDFDYDQSWTPVDEACIDLIGRLAGSDIDLGSRFGDAWAVVLRATRDRSVSCRISRREDPLETAINRPCTRALQAMFQLMGAEFRRDGVIREDGLLVLDETLALEGWDGAEHRAIIAPRLAFLLHLAADWVEGRDPVLFGDSAPGDLGQRTMDLAVKWGRPNRWLLQRHYSSLLRAVRAGSDRAMDHYMVAMLWALPGYSVPEVVRSLSQMGAEQISGAGGSLARMLHSDEDLSHLETGLTFWETILAVAKLPSIALQGFGWWADVEMIDRARWETLTLATCDQANGDLSLSHKVAERAATIPVTSVGLSILSRLLRGPHEPWDRAYIAEIALAALTSTKEELELTEARAKLRTALNDYGFFER